MRQLRLQPNPDIFSFVRPPPELRGNTGGWSSRRLQKCRGWHGISDVRAYKGPVRHPRLAERFGVAPAADTRSIVSRKVAKMSHAPQPNSRIGQSNLALGGPMLRTFRLYMLISGCAAQLLHGQDESRAAQIVARQDEKAGQ